jgi:hypothetical protein
MGNDNKQDSQCCAGNRLLLFHERLPDVRNHFHQLKCVAKTPFILILMLVAFRLFAQPTLPTTNGMFAPVANPYSGSWIYYTTDSVSGLGYLNGASIPYVMAASNNVVNYVNTATNGLVTAGITNGLATTNYVRTATNGFVTAAVTNGLATTNFVLFQNYVTATVTNGLASVNYVNTATNYVLTNDLAQLNAASNVLAGKIIAATNGLVTASITNGLATTNYVNGITNGLASVNYVNTATNGLVTATVTNGLATTNFVTSQGFVTTAVTNGLASISYVNFGTNFVGTNELAQLNSASNALAGQIVTATASALSPSAIWIGVSGGTLAVSSTHYAAPNNNTSMTATTDTTGITRAPVPESLTLTNLYVATSATLGAGHTATLTIMTNGVATPIAVTISGAAQTTGNDTTHSVNIPAGTLIGVRVVTGSSISLVDWSWSFEGW